MTAETLADNLQVVKPETEIMVQAPDGLPLLRVRSVAISAGGGGPDSVTLICEEIP